MSTEPQARTIVSPVPTHLSRARAMPNSLAAVGFPSVVVGVGAVLVGLVAVSLLIRTQALGASLWIDEGLSIGIASHPLLEIPGLLRLDGSPPLYYLLLSGWMAVLGTGPAATQALSLVFALAAIPTALWAGWSLFGRRAGLVCAALAAVSPYLTIYAQEVRMYSLLALLALVAVTAFAHAFVLRRRAYLPVFAASLALALYTHNWGLLLGVGLFAAFLTCVLPAADDRRPLVRDALIGFGAAGLAYLPWLPSLLFQVQNTGAPWLSSPAGASAVRDVVSTVLGGPATAVALALAMVVGLGGLVAFGGWRPMPGRAIPQTRRTTVLALAATVGVTLAAGFLISQVAPAWTPRYLGPVVLPAALVAAYGIARAGRVGAVAAAIVLVLWTISDTGALGSKSNAASLTAEAARSLEPGDLVLSTQAEQVPLLAYHLPDGLDYATPLGPVEDAAVMDWRNALERLEAARPARTLEPLLADLPAARQVLIVHPIVDRSGWSAPWTQLVRRRSAQWGRALERDPRFAREAVLPRFYDGATRVGIRAVLYRKASPRADATSGGGAAPRRRTDS